MSHVLLFVEGDMGAEDDLERAAGEKVHTESALLFDGGDMGRRTVWRWARRRFTVSQCCCLLGEIWGRRMVLR